MFIIEEFIQKSLQTQAQTQLFHWNILWGDAHSALSEYHSTLQSLTDSIVETLLVKLPDGTLRQTVLSIKAVIQPNENSTLEVSKYYREWISKIDEYLSNTLDSSEEEIHHTLLDIKNQTWKLVYKLERLK